MHLIIRGFIEPQKLEQLVQRKLEKHGITKYEYPINPFKLIENEGIILQETPFDDDNIRGMIVHGPNCSGVIINSNRCVASKRFIAMHELAHFWFHPRETQTICFEHYTAVNRSIEWQANNAAAYALMPSDIMRELFEYCEGDEEYMMGVLGVSKDSLTYRINELKLEKKKVVYSYAQAIIDNASILDDVRIYRLA